MASAAHQDGGRADLDRLEGLGRSELREEWRRLYRSPPPAVSRDLLLRALAYRVQEIAEGGLTRAVQRQLASVGGSTAESPDSTGSRAPEFDLRPGARLVREWHGRAHTVLVTKDGFEHAGRSYRSLSEVARAITGARWSGPRFFAPTRRTRAKGRAGAADGAV